MELPINTIVILVVLLALLAIRLVVTSHRGNTFSDLCGDKIEIARDASECEIKCWKCCRVPPTIGKCEKPEINEECNCLC